MTAKAIAVDVLLALAVAMVALSCAGILVMKDVFQKLHYVPPASLVAPLLVALAVTVHEGWSESATETWLAVAFMVATGPVLSHATARAARIRDTGDWRAPDDEVAPPWNGGGA